MSLDVTLIKDGEEVYSANITHNLGKMASEAGIYEALWRPEEIDAVRAEDIINLLGEGLVLLSSRPEYYQKFNSPNGWGTYINFLPWVERYLEACKQYPNALIEVSR